MPAMPLEGRTIAVIEDDPIMGESLIQSLGLEGVKARLYPTARSVGDGGVLRDADLVICDIRLPDMDGPSLFRRLCARADMPPFLFMTAYGEIDQAVALMREGAVDYLTKPFEMQMFLHRVESSLRPVAPANKGALGISPAMREVERLLCRVAKSNSAVLITGETGAGKEVCARYLHQTSKRRGPFMAVNCAAIPSDLLESELFGHEAGAFTGATRRHLGYAERAAAGTLFLDEIGELPLALQAKLLRLIEERLFYRLGGETPVRFEARLVSATNSDVTALMEAKRFRSDLYYRINVVEVTVPPLRERLEDIAVLIAQFFADFTTGRETSVRGLGKLAEQAALTHSWPGNVRELKNRVERAIALNMTGWISPEDLFPERRLPYPVTQSVRLSLAEAREAAERQQIALALAANDGQIARTAEALGVSRTTLWEKMKRYCIAES
jgi:two-component system, NtrC family, response regulator HydG